MRAISSQRIFASPAFNGPRVAAYWRTWHCPVYKNQQAQKNGTPHELTKGRKPVLQKEEDKLFFILFYFKSYPLQEIIAFLFGMSQGQANFWIHTLSGILKMALEKNDFLPKRKRDDLKELLDQEEPQDMTIDGTERRRQRPKDEEKQKEFYSGKKKTHTLDIIGN